LAVIKNGKISKYFN
jgi:hypothetical protein